MSIDVLYELTDSSGTQSEINQSISVSSEGLPQRQLISQPVLIPRGILLCYFPEMMRQASIPEPYSGQRFMETELINATVTVSDDLSDLNELTISWTLY